MVRHQPRRAAASLIAAMLLAGCAETARDNGPSDPQRGSDASGQSNSEAESVDDRRADNVMNRMSAHRATLARLMPGDDLVEDLYLGWRAAPYRRATLAVAIKTMDVLEREVRLRRRGRDVLSDAQVRSMMDWLDDALGDRWAPREAGFRPRHVIQEFPGIYDTLAVDGDVALYAFADRATFTQRDRWMGDFDLLISAGFLVYPVGRHRPLRDSDAAALTRHAAAVGIELVDAPLPSAAERRRGPLDLSLRVRPLTLGELVKTPAQAVMGAAVVDPARDQSWASLIARRALLRGVTGRPPLAVGCVPPGGSDASRAARMRATMWVEAFEGQRLGLVEGWRDLRDGTPTPYVSEFVRPDFLEAVTHTALDLIRWRSDWAGLAARPTVALVIGESHLATSDGNAWSPGFLALAEELLDRQVRYDLIPENSSRLSDGVTRYAAVVRVPAFPPSGSRELAPATSIRVLGGDAPQIVLPAATPRQQAAALADQLAGLVDGHGGRTCTIMDDGEARAAGQELYVAMTASGDHVGIVNLRDVPRRLRLLRTPHGQAGLRDALDDRKVGPIIEIGAFDVRILRSDRAS